MTSFAAGPDGARIAYEVTGAGPPLLLLYGGARSRQERQAYSYVESLADEFTVVTMDQRGHGEPSPSASVARNMFWQIAAGSLKT
jgi:pimeloyl-ACP methyl ester carboxylesterase